VITGLVVALPQEIDTLTTRKVVKGHVVSLSKNLLLAYSGAGAENAETATKLLIQQGTNRLISWGCAAALSPNLQSGNLVLADGLISSDNEIISLDSVWYKQVKTALEKLSLENKTRFVLHTGDLLESKILVAKSSDKQQLYQQTRAIALDMESVSAAKVAQIHKLPFLAIRAIADPVSMDLPEAVNVALNAQGDVEILKLLKFLFTHPKELSGLITLGQQFSAAKRTLKTVASALEHLTA
jgi:adenosylhomocysteine nucleosidase